MSLTKDRVTEVVRGALEGAPGAGHAGSAALRRVSSCDGYVSVTLAAPPDERGRAAVRAGVERAVRRLAEETGAPLVQLSVDFVGPEEKERATVQQPKDVPMKQAASTPTIREGTVRAGSGAAGQPTLPGLPGVRHIIAVGAGKGGVGKSTVSVNLAVALARAGHAVGLLDGDIYGPSVPTLMGLGSMETQVRANMLQPFFVHGVKTMTIGKLVDAEKPLIWRGPMAHGAFKQLVEQTQWGELDYLVIDLPPGTGDVPLTMAQMLALTGAVIVCTPQKVAQDDAVRAARMFQALHIPVLGVVENMSYFIGDDGKEYDLFGRGGAEEMAQRLGLPFLGAIPIHMALRVNSDAGNPSANFGGNAGLRAALEKMKDRVEQEVALAVMRAGSAGPVLTVS